jgi:ABC-2 type transport system ATP-binding protein
MMSNPVIQIKGLTKEYKTNSGPFRALDSLDLQVEPGEIFGYLGPNGAGKTTTIRMLLDLIRPTSGTATILGMDAQTDSVALHRRIGFMPGELALWDSEKSVNIIKYFARVRGNVDMNYVNELSQRLQFDPTKKVRDYSSGNKRKLGLILALMHKPELLILDEPTSGLDPLMQQTFNHMMREIQNEGRTVFLSSHLLSEVQSICDRVGILRNGQLKAVERVDDLTHVDFHWVTLKLRDLAGMEERLRQVDGVTEVSVINGDKLKLRLHGDFDPLLKAVHDRYVIDLHVQDPTLEEIFLAFYDDNPRENLSPSDEQVKEMA